MITRFLAWWHRWRDDRLFTAIANAEHDSWLVEYEQDDAAHARLSRLRLKCARLGKMDLYDRALCASQRERNARYRD